MNKLKEIGNKYYQKCEVVMLAVDKVSNIGLYKDTKNLVFNDHISYKDRGIYQHLYFLSNEKIKEGDWYLNIVSNEIVNVDFNIDYKQNHCKKIIATTDTSLQHAIDKSPYPMEIYGLPQPSKEFIQAFIKAYNEGKPITKVLVEMELDGAYMGHFEGIDCSDYKLKINSSNEITIKKVKDSYTQQEVDNLLDRNTCQITALMLEKFKGYKSREEVIELLSKHFIQAGSKIGLGQDVAKFTKKWIEENL